MINQESIKKSLARTQKFLITQGPIDVFVHHNPLHFFEKKKFDEALLEIKNIKKASVYMRHSEYLEAYSSGRIKDTDIKALFSKEYQKDFKILAAILGVKSSFEIFKKVLLQKEENHNKKTLSWTLRFESEEKKLFYRKLSRKTKILIKQKHKTKNKKIVLIKSNPLEKINNFSYEFLSSYFDQGISYWRMDKRNNDFLSAFIALDLKKNINFLEFSKKNTHFFEESEINLCALIQKLIPNQIEEEDLDYFFYSLLKDIEGWVGIVSSSTQKPLEKLLLFRLILLHSFKGLPLVEKREKQETLSHDEILAKILSFFSSFKEKSLSKRNLNSDNFTFFLEFFLSFNQEKKCSLLQLAYENAYYSKVVTSIELNSKRRNLRPKRPSFSAVFCIDDREESIRRHLEELDPRCETLGYAGFFNMDIKYKAFDSQKERSLCPASITPTKKLQEESLLLSKKVILQKKIQRIFHDQSRTLFFGTVLHMSLMLSNILSDIFKLAFPRLLSKINQTLSKNLKTTSEVPLKEDYLGSQEETSFSYNEAAQRIEKMLETIGKKKDFPSFVFVIGHGATSTNNPHESAYNCGACSGGRGAANARIFARLANNKKVRKVLNQSGIHLSNNTLFIGGYHDTSSDEIDFFDIHLIPSQKKVDFEQHLSVFNKARARDAQERARRFESIPFLSEEKSLFEVNVRAKKYAEPRTECGHATNALCIVGDRELTKGLFLDRRAFLCSYKNCEDKDGSILAALLSSVIPVCSGINLEYYFSYVDNEAFGCGTKLAHNVTSLVGVMNGSQSDLQCGLPWQMVEIHEPVRLLVVVETTKEKLNNLREKIPYVFQLIENSWIHLALFDSKKKEIEFINHSFQKSDLDSIQQKKSSQDCYQRKRGNLDPCLIGASL